MYRIKVIVMLCALAIAVHAQAQTSELKLLVGKKAVAQRMPFYVPGTYQTLPKTYAGQTVKIIDAKPSAMYATMPKLSPSQMASLPPESRSVIENMEGAAVIVVEFPDGTKADTGALPVSANSLASYLSVIAESQNPDATPSAAAGPVHTSSLRAFVPMPSQNCPVIVKKASSTNGGFGHALLEVATKSDYQRSVELQANGFHGPHFLDVRMRNESRKQIRGIEAFAVYTNQMGDESDRSSIISQNDKPIKPGGEYVGYSTDTSSRTSNGVGDVNVYINRVRFEDGTFWQDNGSRSCALTSRIK